MAAPSHTKIKPDESVHHGTELAVTEETVPNPVSLVGLSSASAVASSDPLEAQAGWLRKGWLQNAQWRALAARIGQTQGNQHLQRVVSSLDQLPSVQRSDPEEGRGATWRMARPGETYHGLKTGWPHCAQKRCERGTEVLWAIRPV